MPYQGAHVRTALPGPKSRRSLALQDAAESNARTYPRGLPVAIHRAEGSYVEDVDGNVFLDFLSGAGVLSLGHGHPEVLSAAEGQMRRLVHGLDFPTPVKEAFTRRQLEMLPADVRDRMKVHFCGPTGANAVEAAIKLCKIATGRTDVVAFGGSFHGSTTAAMAVSGGTGIKARARGGMPGVHFFPFSYCARCPLGLRADSCETNCMTYLESVLGDPNGGVPLPAAVVVELIQGEGGTVPATVEFVRRLRELTRAHGIPLIADEVQTGCGRTGTWFAFEQYGIVPDVIVASKAVSGMGLPVSLLFYDRALDVWEPGDHIGTFRGNQLAFAAGLAALDVIARDRVLDNVLARGAQLQAGLSALSARYREILEVRGRGLMWGIELADPVTGRPDGELARRVRSHALRRGLIVELGGRDDAVVRLLPPLNVTRAQVDEAVGLLSAAFEDAAHATATVAGPLRQETAGALP